jgi:hypothetical protein
MPVVDYAVKFAAALTRVLHAFRVCGTQKTRATQDALGLLPKFEREKLWRLSSTQKELDGLAQQEMDSRPAGRDRLTLSRDSSTTFTQHL